MSENQAINSHQPDDNNSHSEPPIQWPTTPYQMNDDAKRAADLARTQIDQAHNQINLPHHQKDLKPTAAQNNQTEAKPQEVDPNFNWQQYHSEWQKYYHRYFYQYYTNWWLQQQPNLKTDDKEDVDTIKGRIRSKVTTRAKVLTKNTHFRSAVVAVTCGLLFLFVNYNQVVYGAVKQYVAPGNVVTTPVIVEANATGKVSKAPTITIPKIGVQAPVVYDEPRVDEASYQSALERGVVRLGNSANPGTNGNVVIGGHSSNNIFNPGKYKYVFVNLRRLDVGDVFYLNYNGQRYTYKIFTAKKIITPKDVSVLQSNGKPIVTLFTCDPPGTNVNRLIVQAIQVDPNPNADSKSENVQTIDNANPLPSTAPSIWSRLLHL